MKLSEALTKIGGGTAEKTAAAAPMIASVGTAAPTSDASERLKQALKEATAPDVVEKTAGQTSPVADLTKMAADLSKSEHEALVKEAHLYGAAVMDGFMARGAQYKEAADKVAPSLKTAEVAGGTDSFEKFAAENPDLVKEAAQVGYTATIQQLEKLAQDAHAKGWNDTVQQIHKYASDAFVAGFKDVVSLIEAAR